MDTSKCYKDIKMLVKISTNLKISKILFRNNIKKPTVRVNDSGIKNKGFNFQATKKIDWDLKQNETMNTQAQAMQKQNEKP